MRWLASLVLLLCAAPARAADADGTVAFTELAAQIKEPDVWVSYRVDPKSWRWAQGRGIEPVLVLDVRLPGGRSERQQIKLVGPEGRPKVTLANFRAVDTIDVSLAAAGKQRLYLGLGRVEVASARLRLYRDGAAPPADDAAPPPRTDWSRRPDTIKACGAAFSGDDATACLDAAAQFVLDPLPAIAACKKTMTTYAQRIDCVRAVAPAPYDVTRALEQCARVVPTYDDRAACVRAAGGAAVDPSASIAACGEMRSYAERNACIARSVGGAR